MAKVAVLMLTPRCNMQCEFCGADAGFVSMPYDKARDLVDTLAGEGTTSVVLGGGEPFYWGPSLESLAAHVRERGMLAQVGTNATLVPEDDGILGSFDRWILPLESLNQGVHDGMRPYTGGHFDKVLGLLDRLRLRGIEVTISSLVTKENVGQLEELGAYLRWYQKNGGRVHAWHLYRFLPVGRGGRLHDKRFATAPGVFESVGQNLKSSFQDLQVYLRPDMYHSKHTSFHWWHAGEMQSFRASLDGPHLTRPVLPNGPAAAL